MFEACAVIKIQENHDVLGLGVCPRIALVARIARNSGACKSALQKGISEEVAGQKGGQVLLSESIQNLALICSSV